jgi:hypothetical protein
MILDPTGLDVLQILTSLFLPAIVAILKNDFIPFKSHKPLYPDHISAADHAHLFKQTIDCYLPRGICVLSILYLCLFRDSIAQILHRYRTDSAQIQRGRYRAKWESLFFFCGEL